jgi:hypothetical protein
MGCRISAGGVGDLITAFGGVGQQWVQAQVAAARNTILHSSAQEQSSAEAPERSLNWTLRIWN